jgi:hypothetical protein
MSDFEQESPGYANNRRICDLLGSVDLQSDGGSAADNLVACYQLLVEHAVFPAAELALVDAWLGALSGANTTEAGLR